MIETRKVNEMKKEKACDYPDADYRPHEFESYEDFLNWLNEDNGTRLKHKFIDGFILKTEPEILYFKVLDCLNAHEE